MHFNKTKRITFAAIITMITLSTGSLNSMLNALIGPHENHDDFFRAIDTGDIDQVANIVKQGKAPKKDDQRLNAYLAKVLTPSYRDELQVNHHKLIGSSVGKLVWKPVKKTQKYKQNEIIKQLIACGANIHYTNDDGWGYLHQAVLLKNLGALEIFLSQQPKPNVNILDFNGETPLHVAAKNGFYPAAEMLLAHGADVNAIDSEGNTALLIVLKNISDNADRYMQSYFWSSYEEKVDLADRLITQPRADITIVNKDGKCALDYALHVSEYLCYKLLAYGAHVKQDYFDEKKFPHPDCFRARLYFLPILRAAQYADEIVKGEDPILKTAQYGKHLQYCKDQAKQYADKIAKVTKGERLVGYLFSKPQKDVLVARLRKIKRTDLLQRIGLEEHSIQFEDRNRKPYAYFATR